MQKVQSDRENLSTDDEPPEEQIAGLFDMTWNDWVYDRRRRYAKEELRSVGGYGGYGESLRTLRSPLIESWLAVRDQGKTVVHTLLAS